MTRNIGILGAMAQEIDEVKALLTEKTTVKIASLTRIARVIFFFFLCFFCFAKGMVPPVKCCI